MPLRFADLSAALRPRLGPYLLGALTATAAASVVQTQIDLAAIAALGGDVTPAVRLRTTGQDLLAVARTLAPIVFVTLAVALAVATLLARRISRRMAAGRAGWTALCAAAGGLGFVCALQLVDALAPMPTLIAATRGAGGLAAMAACVAAGGAVFATASGGPVAMTTASRRSRGWPFALAAVTGVWVAAAALSGRPFAPSGAVPVASPSYRVDSLAEGLDDAWSIAFLPDGRALVSERPGRLRVVAAGRLAEAPITGLPDGLYPEGMNGPLDIALDPRFAENGFVYLAHAHGNAAANNVRVTRFRLVGDRAEDVRVLFDAKPAKAGLSNNGSRLAFLPDETLLVTVGDGFDRREAAQDPASHLGKVLRLTRDGGVPADNPFVGRAGHAPEVWTLGHRNPQGLAVVDGVAWISDHGPRGGDRLDRLARGANFGWPLTALGHDYTWARVSPFTEAPGIVPPRRHWAPSIAPAGLMVYTGAAFPAWRGDLLVPALVSRAVHRVRMVEGRLVAEEALFAELGLRVRDLRQAPDGSLWLLSGGRSGRLLRISPRGRREQAPGRGCRSSRRGPASADLPFRRTPMPTSPRCSAG